MIALPLTVPRTSPLFGVMLAWHRYIVLAEAELIAASDPDNRQAAARVEWRRELYLRLPECDRERVEGWASR